MRFAAASSRPGMLTKWRAACAITVSTSGRISDPPSMVIVPSGLMTAVTPSSLYGSRECPKPLRFGEDSGGDDLAPRSLGVTKNDPAIAVRVPRNPRRLQLSFMCALLFLSFPGQRRDAVDFYQRVSRKSSNGNGSAGGSAMREVGFEYFVHAVVVVDLCDEHAKLHNAIHCCPTALDWLLHVVPDLLG